MSARLAAAAGLLAILAALAVVLLQRAPRRSGTDLTPNGAFVKVLSAGQQTCQGQELLPADTAALQLTIGTYGKPGPPLSVNVSGPRGELLTAGGLRTGWKQGVVRIPVAHVSTATEGARVCLRNSGPQPVALAGVPFEVPQLRIDYTRPGSESWLALAPTLVHRFSLGKSGFVRHWAWVAALVLMLFVVALATRTIVSEEEPRP